MTETSRVALVTGGTKGIGAACANRLQNSGYNVAVCSRNKPESTNDFFWTECDISDTASVDAAFTAVEAELGPVEVLVANAGVTRDMLMLRMSVDDFEAVLDTNLTGAFRVAKRAIKPMMKQRWGRIVFMSSVVASMGQAGQANYAASKAGLSGLGRSLAREFGSRGITVNVVAPGPTETDMLAALTPEQIAAMVDHVPVGRAGTADEVAAAVSFLVSEEAGYVTGTTIAVDGGLGMGA